jgi:DNA (cytosine-5)-methyltransferase 1
MSYKLLDLFCGAGGCSEGYRAAGFDVTGVDIAFQKRYPKQCSFLQADVMHLVNFSGFDVVHASPPCQAYSKASQYMRNKGSIYPDLIAAVREKLVKSNCLYVIENVVGAPLLHPVQLCGTSFGLGSKDLQLVRHRWFECNAQLLVPPCQHGNKPVAGVYGHGMPTYQRKRLGRDVLSNECREVMGISWMSRTELSQAIPPAYTTYIGEQLIAILNRSRAIQPITA